MLIDIFVHKLAPNFRTSPIFIMQRTIWFCLVCLIGVIVLFSARSFAPSTHQKQGKVIESYSDDHELSLAFKTDKLPENNDELQPRKVQTLKVASEAVVQEVDAKKEKQWRPTYARMRGVRHIKERHHRRLKRLSPVGTVLLG